MSECHNHFQAAIAKRLETIVPGVFERLDDMESLPGEAADLVLSEMLEYACTAQNCANIVAARKAIGRMPVSWLERRMPIIAERALNLKDDWEYRRLLELILEVTPSLLPEFIERGMTSEDESIREAAMDMDLARQKREQGMSE